MSSKIKSTNPKAQCTCHLSYRHASSEYPLQKQKLCLSQQQHKNLQELFLRADKDCNDHLKISELQKFASMVGVDLHPLDAVKVISTANGESGPVSQISFEKLVNYVCHSGAEHPFSELFQAVKTSISKSANISLNTQECPNSGSTDQQQLRSETVKPKEAASLPISQSVLPEKTTVRSTAIRKCPTVQLPQASINSQSLHLPVTPQITTPLRQEAAVTEAQKSQQYQIKQELQQIPPVVRTNIPLYEQMSEDAAQEKECSETQVLFKRCAKQCADSEQ